MKIILLTCFLAAQVSMATTIFLRGGQSVQIANTTVVCEGGNYPPIPPTPPTPPVPPQPRPNECRLVGSGFLGGVQYPFIIMLDNRAVEGAYSLQNAIGKIQELRNRRICSPTTSSVCEVSATAVVNGVTYPQAVFIDGYPVVGSYGINPMLGDFRNLTSNSVCYSYAQNCGVGGAANIGGIQFSHTVYVGRRLAAGAYSLDSAHQILNQFRYERLCTN